MSKDISQKTQVQDADSDFDDDLLDDVLDDMTSVPAKAPEAKPDTKSSEKLAQNDSSSEEAVDGDEFAKQLAAGMEQLMGQMDDDEEMKKAFESIWSSYDKPTGATGTSREANSGKKTTNFQETIGQTMNKLKDSSKEIDSSIADESEDAFMAELMKQMESLADSGDFENVLEGMMSQLMSKEMLYEPMKELSEKYPDWLEKNKDKVEKADYEKYEQQFDICKKIVAKYDAPDFDEKNEAQGKVIMDLMTKMQDLGQPPAEILDSVAPGMNFGNPEGMPDMKDLENCNIM
ncbi:Pex19 protein [Backusella circina FSU 941]|nr:Pex19 protein [Backusella circina FSU 941]